jgi:hypothetical protein
MAASPDAALLEAETPPAHRSKEQQVEDILSGAAQAPAEQPPEAPETGAEPEPAAETPLDVAGLAERLGVDPAKLYEVRIPLADGAEPVTLGQLKDAYRDAEAIEAQRGEVTKQRGEWHADQLRQQRELDEILSAITPDKVSPELAQAVQKVNRERLSREAEALLRTVPEWTDAKTREADLVSMADTLTAYGITRADVDALTDHRVLRAFRRLAQLERAVQAKPVPKQPPKSQQAPRRSAQPTPAQDFGRLKAAVTKGQVRPVDAVTRILGVK